MTKEPEKEDLPASSEERRADEERVVHVEEMKATVGEVLQHEHVEEAVRLHVVREEMPPAPPSDAGAREERAGDEQRQREERREPGGPRSAPRRARRVVWRHLASPLFLITASRQAAHELRAGVADARRDLRRAAERAAQAFTG